MPRSRVKSKIFFLLCRMSLRELRASWSSPRGTPTRSETLRTGNSGGSSSQTNQRGREGRKGGNTTGTWRPCSGPLQWGSSRPRERWTTAAQWPLEEDLWEAWVESAAPCPDQSLGSVGAPAVGQPRVGGTGLTRTTGDMEDSGLLVACEAWLYYNADISRIKAEVKTENDMMEGEPPVKRVKMEKWYPRHDAWKSFVKSTWNFQWSIIYIEPRNVIFLYSWNTIFCFDDNWFRC